jgi:ribonuclease Z
MHTAMRQFFEARLVNDAFGDPGLYVDFRDQRRALLFDLGDIGVLPPRKLLRVSHAFITHSHMDHFFGFDQFVRVVLGRKPGVVLFGGPGFIAQVEHKLRAYTWNVVHRYAEFTIDVREVGTLGSAARALFSSRNQFAREPCAALELHGDTLLDEPLFRVRGRFVDHGTPCLAFAVEEKAHVNVAKDRLAALGVSTGAWLRELKHAVLSGAPDSTPIPLQWRDARGEHQMTRPLGELRDVVLNVGPGLRVGYVTDLRFTQANVETLVQLLGGVDRLFIESVFLNADLDHATRKNHLTASQAGEIARRVGAKAVVPFHFSPRYEGRAAELIEEVNHPRSAFGARLGD